MLDYKIYKKDLKKDKNKKIIVKIFDKKNYYIITTLQAIEDYKKTYFLAYDKMAYNKSVLLKYLEEV